MNMATKSKRIYPKEYTGYVFWSLLWIIISTMIIVPMMLSLDTNIKLRLDKDTFIICTVLLSLCFYTTTTIITCIFLKNRKIYIEYSNELIIYNGLYLKRRMNISDIRLITRDNCQNILGYTLIGRKHIHSEVSARYIRFPMVWFSDKDINYMLEQIKSYNKDVKIDFFYTNTYTYSHNKKRK